MPAKPPEKRKRRRYSLEERERGLMALVLEGPRGASERTGIPHNTLIDWRTENPDRYDQLRNELAPKIAEKIAAEAEQLAVAIAEREALIVQALSPEAVGSMDAKELAGTLRNLSTSKALQIDKISSPLRGRPTHIVAHEDPNEAASRLLQRLGVVDTTATDITEPTSAFPTASDRSNTRELPASSTAD